MEKNDKKNYEPPELTVVHFKVEHGFNNSSTTMSIEQFTFDEEDERNRGLYDYDWAEFTW